MSPAASAQEGSNAIALTITDDRQAVTPGTEITYQITARNSSTSEMKAGKLVMNIPDYIVPSSTVPESLPDPTARTITWSNITLAAGKQQVFSVRARIAAETPSGLLISTTVELTAPNIKSNATDTTNVDKQPFIIAGQAATTTAPAPSPRSVTPTAATGAASTVALIASTIIGSLGLLHIRRRLA